jgi:iron complex transport system ATP-binding protein
VVSVLHEVSLALQADDMVVMANGRVLHQGACGAPATHAALEEVFDHRIQVRHLDGLWMALPSLQRQNKQ